MNEYTDEELRQAAQEELDRMVAEVKRNPPATTPEERAAIRKAAALRIREKVDRLKQSPPNAE